MHKGGTSCGQICGNVLGSTKVKMHLISNWKEFCHGVSFMAARFSEIGETGLSWPAKAVAVAMKLLTDMSVPINQLKTDKGPHGLLLA
jgi:hypothetical protein